MIKASGYLNVEIPMRIKKVHKGVVTIEVDGICHDLRAGDLLNAQGNVLIQPERVAFNPRPC